jgi:hypothetical protein
MQYKTIPFDPGATRKDAVTYAASQLESLINQAASSGWEFVELANYSTVVPGSPGCFGFFATSPYAKTISMAVFRK